MSKTAGPSEDPQANIAGSGRGGSLDDVSPYAASLKRLVVDFERLGSVLAEAEIGVLALYRGLPATLD